MGEKVDRRAPWLLAALVLLVATLLWTQAVQIHLWTQDEEYFVQLSRLLTEHFPSAVVDLPVQPFDERGIQRLTILLLALPLSVINGETGVELARAAQCLVFATAAIPAYALARGLRLEPRWALLVAALTIVVPWGILTGSFLTEPVAYPAALWAFYGAWRACVRPGLRSDVLAIALVVLAGLARTNLLVLVAVAPLAVTLHTLASVGWRRLPAQLWRDHPLFAVVIVPGAIIAILNAFGVRPGPLGSLSGGYVTSLNTLEWGPIPEKFALQTSRIVTGIGILPVVFGLPWMLRQAFRRTRPEYGALAICALVAYLVILVSTVYAASEERYLMHTAPFLLIPGLVAIIRRDVAPWALAVSGLAVGVLLWRVEWPFTVDQSFFLTDPSQAFVSRVVLGHLPGQGAAALGALVAGAGLLAALALWRVRAAAGVTLAVLAVLAAIQVVQTDYVVTKRVSMQNNPGTLEDWTWIDDRVGDATVAIHATGMANGPDYSGSWRDTAFWNRRVDAMVTDGYVNLQIPRHADVTEVKIADDGRMVSRNRFGIPRYLLEPTLFRSQGVLADPVERSTYLAIELVKLRGAPRVTYQWSGTDADGWLSAENPRATVRAYPPALETAPDACLRVRLNGPLDGTKEPVRFAASAGDERWRGALRPREHRDLEVPLRTGRERLRIRASNLPPAEGDQRSLGLLVAETRVGACGAS